MQWQWALSHLFCLLQVSLLQQDPAQALAHRLVLPWRPAQDRDMRKIEQWAGVVLLHLRQLCTLLERYSTKVLPPEPAAAAPSMYW